MEGDSVTNTHPAAPSTTLAHFLWKGDDFRPAAIDERLQMLAPRDERAAHLVRVPALIVDLCRAAAESTIMAEDALDHMRLHVQVVG
jgi:hypothetical protein